MKNYAKNFYSLFTLKLICLFFYLPAYAGRTFVNEGSNRDGFLYKNLETGNVIVIPWMGLEFLRGAKLDTLYIEQGSIRHYFLKMGLAKVTGTLSLPGDMGKEQDAKLAKLGFWKKFKEVGWRKAPKEITSSAGVTRPLVSGATGQFEYLGSSYGMIHLREIHKGSIVSFADSNLVVDFHRIKSIALDIVSNVRLELIKNGSVGLKLPKLASRDEQINDLYAKRNKLGIWQFYSSNKLSGIYIIERNPPTKKADKDKTEPEPGSLIQRLKKFWEGLHSNDVALITVVLSLAGAEILTRTRGSAS